MSSHPLVKCFNCGAPWKSRAYECSYCGSGDTYTPDAITVYENMLIDKLGRVPTIDELHAAVGEDILNIL